MRHWAVPASNPQPRALVAPLALSWLLACSTPLAAAQGFDGPLSADPPSLPPFALTVGPSLLSTLPWQAGLDVGVSWHAQLSKHKTIDVTAWRRMPQPPFDAISQIQQRDPLYGARVEMKLDSGRSRFTTELRAIGLQLDNGARILLRRRNGNPTLYYRAQF